MFENHLWAVSSFERDFRGIFDDCQPVGNEAMPQPIVNCFETWLNRVDRDLELFSEGKLVLDAFEQGSCFLAERFQPRAQARQ